MANPQRDVHLLSRVLMIVGAIMVLVGVMVLASRPAEIEMGQPGWFETEDVRMSRTFVASTLGMFGIVAVVAGVMLTRRARAIGFQLTTETVAAVAHGVSAGLGPHGPHSPLGHLGESRPSAASRLETLEDIRNRGLLSDHEYQAKRNQILAGL